MLANTAVMLVFDCGSLLQSSLTWHTQKPPSSFMWTSSYSSLRPEQLASLTASNLATLKMEAITFLKSSLGNDIYYLCHNLLEAHP